MQSQSPSRMLAKETVTAEMNAILQESRRRASHTSGGRHASFTSSQSASGRDDSPERACRNWTRSLHLGRLMTMQSHNINIDTLSRFEEFSDINEDESKDEEDKMKKFLGALGVCCKGYAWNRIENGWQCEGRSRSMNDHDIRRQMQGWCTSHSPTSVLLGGWGSVRLNQTHTSSPKQKVYECCYLSWAPASQLLLATLCNLTHFHCYMAGSRGIYRDLAQIIGY